MGVTPIWCVCVSIYHRLRETWTVDFADLSWTDVTSFTLDDNDTVFVVGKVDEDDYRAVAKVLDDGDVDWAYPVATTSGTPVILLTATEILLCSESFFARVSQTKGSTLFLLEEESLWLPESGTSIVTYDAATDTILSAAYVYTGFVDGQFVASQALIRQSSASTGKAFSTLDFWTELARKAESPRAVIWMFAR